MANWLLLVIVGIVCLVVDWAWASAPPIAHTIFRAVGAITLIVGVLLFVVGLLGVG